MDSSVVWSTGLEVEYLDSNPTSTIRGLYEFRQIIWILLYFFSSYVKGQWCLSSSSHNVKVPCNQRCYCADTLPYKQGSPGPWAHTWSSSRQLLRRASQTLSRDNLIGLLMDVLWLSVTDKVKPMLLIWINQILCKLAPVYLFFLSPGDIQYRVLSINHLTMGQALLSVFYMHWFINPYKHELCRTMIPIQMWKISLRKASNMSMNLTILK